jgi:hypothetical protein
MDVLTDLHLDALAGEEAFAKESGDGPSSDSASCWFCWTSGFSAGAIVGGVVGIIICTGLFMALIYCVLVPCWRRRHGLGPLPTTMRAFRAQARGQTSGEEDLDVRQQHQPDNEQQQQQQPQQPPPQQQQQQPPPRPPPPTFTSFPTPPLGMRLLPTNPFLYNPLNLSPFHQ